MTTEEELWYWREKAERYEKLHSALEHRWQKIVAIEPVIHGEDDGHWSIVMSSDPGNPRCLERDYQSETLIGAMAAMVEGERKRKQ